MEGEFAGAIAAVIGTAIGAWLLDRWLGVRTRVANWWRSVKARKSATEAMVSSWPTIVEGMGRYTEQFTALSDGLSALGIQIKTGHAGFDARLDKQDQSLASIMAQQWGSMKLDPQARFICDSEGRNSEVNTAYAQMLRVGEASIKQFGYKNYIDPAQLPKYMAMVLQAFTEHRRFEGTVVMIRGDGSRFLAHIRLEPYPEDPSDGDASHWFGAVTNVEEMD